MRLQWTIETSKGTINVDLAAVFVYGVAPSPLTPQIEKQIRDLDATVEILSVDPNSGGKDLVASRRAQRDGLLREGRNIVPSAVHRAAPRPIVVSDITRQQMRCMAAVRDLRCLEESRERGGMAFRDHNLLGHHTFRLSSGG